MRAGLAKVGAPPDLVQVLPPPASKEMTAELMRLVDLVVVTGSQANVRQAYSSGTPAIGVGAGNVPVIVDETADLPDAARKIAASKTFDNATSCSSENAVVVLDACYPAAIAALEEAGGYVASVDERERIVRTLWQGGKLNRAVIARDPDVQARAFGLGPASEGKRFFLVEEEGIGPEHPLSGEKLSLVLAVYRARDFDHAVEITRRLLEYQGKGHSCGIHTRDERRARRLAGSCRWSGCW
jgi:sulfoacetaldehyde dehydrogenase